MKKYLLNLVLFILTILLSVSANEAEEVEQDVAAYVEVVPTIFLGDNEGDDDMVDDDGIVFATLDNNGADICELDWGDGFEGINPSLESIDHTYFDTGEKLVKYRCKLEGQDESLFVEANDTIAIAVAAPEIIIHSPEDGFFYETGEIPINVTISKTVREIRYSDNGGSFRILCLTNSTFNCTGAFEIRHFDDGHHIFTVKVVDNLRNFFKTVEFDVDSAPPKIRDIFPEDGEFTNGTFTVIYDENLLNRVILFWRFSDEDAFRQAIREDCPSGKKQTCSINVNFDEEEGREVNYYFEVHNGQRFDRSATNRVRIDMVNPEITILSPVNNSVHRDNKVIFNITINEEVELEYMDLLGDNTRFNRMCRNCDEYGNSMPRNKRFDDGDHKILVRAIDGADRQDMETVGFFVDTKDPRIAKTLPRRGDYTNGSFMVRWREDNMKQISLFYSDRMISRNDCPFDPEGRTQECEFNPDLMDFDGEILEYWFEIEDIAGNKDESRKTEINADLTPPNITRLNYTVDGNKFDIEVSEEVKLEYFDENEDRPRWRTFCRRCDSYDRRKSFRSGEHNLMVRAVDNVGNSDLESINFSIN